MTDGFTGQTRQIVFEGVSFEVDAVDPSRPAWFALGVRKSGSSMFMRAVKLMAKFNRVNWVDIAGDLFDNNVPVTRWREKAPPPGLLMGGNVYGGFRDFPVGLATDPVFAQGIKVLLVRDPRDAIVSEYFSTARTHSIPQETGDDGAREDMLRRREAAQGMTVETFARREAEKMAGTIERYIPLIDDPKLLVLKYEDMVFDKPTMVRLVTEHFGWRIQPQQIDAILKWIDVRPDVEDPTKFIRKVTPGDHRDKLSPPVIAELDDVLGEAMEAFGYR